MKTVNNTLEAKFTAIEKEAAEKKAAAILQQEIANKTGIAIDNVFVYSSGSVKFGWRKPISKEEIKSIITAYPINGANYEMRFASSEKNFTTDSPLILKWTNSESCIQQRFEIKYTSNGLEICIEVPVSHFGNHVYYQSKQGKHKGFGRYEMHRMMFIDYFYTQSYSGGYNTLYFLEGAESIEEYENFVLTGEFKYKDEIK
jgi:hypothetical protein